MLKSIKQFFSEYVSPFIMRDGKVKPIKVFISALLLLTVAAVAQKIINPSIDSTAFISVLYGGLAILIGADVWRSNTKDQCTKKTDEYDEYIQNAPRTGEQIYTKNVETFSVKRKKNK